jgi:hypothetical protein
MSELIGIMAGNIHLEHGWFSDGLWASSACLFSLEKRWAERYDDDSPEAE